MTHHPSSSSARLIELHGLHSTTLIDIRRRVPLLRTRADRDQARGTRQPADNAGSKPLRHTASGQGSCKGARRVAGGCTGPHQAWVSTMRPLRRSPRDHTSFAWCLSGAGHTPERCPDRPKTTDLRTRGGRPGHPTAQRPRRFGQVPGRASRMPRALAERPSRCRRGTCPELASRAPKS